MSKKIQLSTTKIEAGLDNAIGNDLEKAINKIQSGKGKKLNNVREDKLYREEYGTFSEYIKKEVGVVREYGHDLAKVARFRELTGNFREEVSSMSHNAQDQFVINHNKRIKGWQMKKTYLPKFTSLIEQIIGVTISSVENNKIKITPAIINVCDNVITNFLNAEDLEYDDDLVDEATKKLKDNRERLVAVCKEQLTTNISKTPKNCVHIQEIIAIEKNLLTLKCGCVFKLV